MKRFGRRILSAVPAVVVAGVCVTMLLVQHACILAQPSGELPRIPESRPTILRASAVPPTSAVLTRWPVDSTFLVPVELADPNVEFRAASFIDYNPLTGDGLVEERKSVYEVSNSSSNTVGRARTLTILIPEPAPDRCHTIEVVVALHLASDTDLTGDPKLRHTPLAPGGDIATWFYNPKGDFGACPSLDAGIDAGMDAASDASEGGAQ